MDFRRRFVLALAVAALSSCGSRSAVDDIKPGMRLYDVERIVHAKLTIAEAPATRFGDVESHQCAVVYDESGAAAGTVWLDRTMVVVGVTK
jgi:hypothetical protein